MSVESSTVAEMPVLLIDDDEELGVLLSRFLEKEGFEIHVEVEGRGGLERARSGQHGAVILDVMMPGMNGFDLLRELRRTSNVPVIMLTARGQDIDRIVGLEMGADDYIGKPFNPRELAARLRAIQRRARPSPNTAAPPDSKPVLVVGDIELNPRARRVNRAGDEVSLTSVEFALLEILMLSAGRIVSREDLSSRGLGRRLSQTDRSIDVHVSNLRKKLGLAPGGSDRIKTVRGLGYQYSGQ
jgi:DNA-binding response OmpR family regulator